MTDQSALSEPTDHAARVVIIGAGFAGLEAAKALGRAGIDTLVVDRENHHLFQPLLYQVATAALSATDVAEPVRRILRARPSVRVLMGAVEVIDPADRTLRLRSGERIGYHTLVLASGARPSYFGHDAWARHAPGLKTIEDARRIRTRLLMTFERAERATDPDERRRHLTIAIIGGGPTGVEMAGSIAELARFTLARDFRRIDPRAARIVLVEAGARLLAAFDDSLSDYARARLTSLGVEVMTGQPVEDIGADQVVIGASTIPVGLVIWAAGITASPLAAQLGRTDRGGRIAVGPDLAVPGHDRIYALGDAAAFMAEDGRPLPGLAQVAKQQGLHLGRGLAAQFGRGAPLAPFR